MTASTAPHDDRSVRPPFSWRRVQFPLLSLVALILFVIALSQTGVSPAKLVGSLDDVANLFARMWPPVATEWPRYLEAIWVTFLMVIASTGLAFLAAIPMSILAARNTTPHGALHTIARGAIVLTRAIPSIVWALLLVRAIGIGPLAGVLAMSLSSLGMLGKLFADAVEDVDSGPVEALISMGATRSQVFASGVLPQVMPAWLSLVLFRLDINVRRSVILGFVGAGGIGFELQRVLGQLVYPRALTIVAMIFVFILIVEQLSAWVRRTLIGDSLDPYAFSGRGSASSRGSSRASGVAHARTVRLPWNRLRILKAGAVAGAAALFLVASWLVGLTPASLGKAVVEFAGVARRMFPPDFATNWDGIVAAMLETVWIALAATVLGMTIAVPIAILAARNTSPNRLVSLAARGLMLIQRGVPELILAVIFVVAVGLGPFAGILALTIGAIGFTGKLMADALETLPDAGRVALASVGATWSQRTTGAVLPQAMPMVVGIGLYTLDVYVRAATILGIVGAGGVGGILNSTIQSHRYDRTLAICILIFVLIFGVERLAGWARKSLR